jgi:hypothetical protein
LDVFSSCTARKMLGLFVSLPQILAFGSNLDNFVHSNRYTGMRLHCEIHIIMWVVACTFFQTKPETEQARHYEKKPIRFASSNPAKKSQSIKVGCRRNLDLNYKTTLVANAYHQLILGKPSIVGAINPTVLQQNSDPVSSTMKYGLFGLVALAVFSVATSAPNRNTILDSSPLNMVELLSVVGRDNSGYLKKGRA